MHVYQPGYLYVALGEAKGHWLSREERTLLRRDVDLAIEKAVRIHPDARHRAARAGRQPRLGLPGGRDRVAARSRADPRPVRGRVRVLFARRRAAAGAGAAPVRRRPDQGRRRRHPLQVPTGARRVHVHGRGVPAAQGCPRPERDRAALAAEPRVHDRVRLEADPAVSWTSAASGSRRSSTWSPSIRAPAWSSRSRARSSEYDLLVLVPPHRGPRS